MGEYNPNLPVIIGQEWVPIRNEDLVFDEAVNAFEQGHGFQLATARTVGFGRFYASEPPHGIYENQAYTMSVYRAEDVDSAGPIRRVVIPVNNGDITGSGVLIFLPDTSVPEALNNPGTSLQRGIDIQSGNGAEANVNIHFAVNQYANALDGKRILAVNFLYQYRMATTTITTDTTGDIFFYLTQNPGTFSFQYVFPSLATANPLFPPVDSRQFVRRRVGDVAMYYQNDPFTQVDVIPWTYAELQKFEEASTGQIITHIRSLAFADVGPRITINYMAMEVLYCEENRTLFGTRLFNASPMAAADEVRINWGANDIFLHPTSSPDDDDPILQAGDYVLTVNQASMGDNIETLSNFGPQAKLNALRELYAMPLQPGVRLDIPFPLDEFSVNRQLTETTVEVLPQLSLHTSGAGTTLTEPHPYGRQAWAEVWGNNTAVQELTDTGSGAARSYPWVRFYARRWGDTTIPLTLAGVGGLSGSTVSITPDEFDLLPEIIDGWKQVDLRFATPPTIGLLGALEFEWSASGEVAGNRWEVLGAVAPALDPAVGAPFNQIPLQQQLYEATYEAPTGSTQELEWFPQGVADDYVSVQIADDASDIAILLSVDPPAVSGFGITTLCQPISGIGQNCGVDPCCIPSSITFNQLVFTAVGLDGPIGHEYEIQRMDEIEDWKTIMLSGPSLGGLVLPGVAGSYASTPDTAALDITGDIDIRGDLTLDDWNTSSEQTIVSKFGAAGTRSYTFYIDNLTGLPTIEWSTDGTTLFEMSATVVPPVANGERIAVRVTLDVNNGAGGRTATFYTAPAIGGPWTQLGATVTDAGTTSIFSGPSQMEVGSNGGGAGALISGGVVHAVQVRDGISGTVVANPDFSEQVEGTTVFTDSAGRVWTLQGDAFISDTFISTTFNDFEARVGITSAYQIRVINAYGFAGPWSTAVSGMIDAPGVSIGCQGDGHLLIFTSNERQSGAINLAYSSVWMDQQVQEDFAFPEAGFVQLQPMYDRDFFTAFRPMERGGEQFQRTVLVQAAAIAPETLADFTSLRNMAWEAVNYICVRDEDGNRWFATVGVPSGRVMNRRKLYLAPVQIVEVTDTPTPVDLANALVQGTVATTACE